MNMSSTVEQIKEKLDITDVVGSYLKLENAGSNLKARCPFHNEKTPSFFVSPSRQTYHCFGCNKGGDMFSFVQEIEGLDFPGVLKVLADKAGVEVKHSNPKEQSEKEKLFSILEEAAMFFERNLKTQKQVIEYLKKRGLNGEIAKKFRVGYAPEGWNCLQNFLKTRNFSDALIEKAGLIIKGNKGYYDRFRDRIMFPLTDSSGRVVGFSGRAFGSNDENTAKYINTPLTVLYDKSKILYGFDRAKLSIRKSNFCVLVEGQMDLLLSAQVGVTNTVAVSGTALTGEHLRLLKRLTDNLVIAFDSDEAGVLASKRGVDMALSLGFDVKIADLPRGFDPAELIQKNKEQWKKSVENAEHIIDFYLKAFSSKGYDKRTFRVKTSELVLPYVAQLKNKINQAHFISEIARKLDISEEPLWEEFRNLKSMNEKTLEHSMEVKNNSAFTMQKSRKDMIERKILGILFWQEAMKDSKLNIKKARSKYKEVVGESALEKEFEKNKEKKKELIFEAEIYYGDVEEIEKEFNELMYYLQSDILKEEFTFAMNELRTVEGKGDTEEAAKILKKCQDISKRINNLKH
jgi:DNA primase